MDAAANRRTDADAEQHRWHELQRNVSIEQRRGRIAGARLDQSVNGAAHRAAGDHRVTQPRAQLKVCLATHTSGQTRNRPPGDMQVTGFQTGITGAPNPSKLLKSGM